MKEEILNNIKMIDILNKYGITYKNSQISCPFHGIDKNPSAHIYENNFHCFTCLEHLDVIGFVQKYFNLSFIDAMKKINYDFGLGLEDNKVDRKKLTEIRNIQNEKKHKKQMLINRYSELCDIKIEYKKLISYFSKRIKFKNWETLTKVISDYKIKVYEIEQELNEIDEILSNKF